MYYTSMLAFLWLLQCFRWGLAQFIIDCHKVREMWQSTKQLGKNSAYIVMLLTKQNPMLGL